VSERVSKLVSISANGVAVKKQVKREIIPRTKVVIDHGRVILQLSIILFGE
jgi:hypothetical protein